MHSTLFIHIQKWLFLWFFLEARVWVDATKGAAVYRVDRVNIGGTRDKQGGTQPVCFDDVPSLALTV